MSPLLSSVLLFLSLHPSISPGVSSCRLACSTDYLQTINCSCSAPPASLPVQVAVVCSGVDLLVGGSCEMAPPLSWCSMLLEDLEEVASIGTSCNSTVSGGGGATETSSWDLSDVVKPLAPSNVCVLDSEDSLNISWSHEHNAQDCLEYRVRIRSLFSQDSALLFQVEVQRWVVLDRQELALQPRRLYRVDVQARLCQGNTYRGPWSEWSPPLAWRETHAAEEVKGLWWWVSLGLGLGLVLVLALLLLGYLHKPCFQEKLKLWTLVPKPDYFFQDLYVQHRGNFKDWVAPVFSEFDYLRLSSNVPAAADSDFLLWNEEKRRHSKDCERNPGPAFHRAMLALPANVPPLHLPQYGGSTGHVSIHTVTLSGQDGEQEVASQSSIDTLRSYRSGGSFGSFEEDNADGAGSESEDPQMSRRDGMAAQEAPDRNLPPPDVVHEPERVSLDSFVSIEQSDDGYPRVDLDTIDSGFGECSSPGAADPNRAAQSDYDLFSEHQNLNSNYVKQWMICSSAQEDPRTLEEEPGTLEEHLQEVP